LYKHARVNTLCYVLEFEYRHKKPKILYHQHLDIIFLGKYQCTCLITYFIKSIFTQAHVCILNLYNYMIEQGGLEIYRIIVCYYLFICKTINKIIHLLMMSQILHNSNHFSS